MLGVIIGVMSVIVLIAIGQGTTACHRIHRFDGHKPAHRLHPDAAWAWACRAALAAQLVRKGHGHFDARRHPRAEDDASIRCVSSTTSGSLTVKAGSTNTTATVMGVLPAYAQIVNQGVQSGRHHRRGCGQPERQAAIGPIWRRISATRTWSATRCTSTGANSNVMCWCCGTSMAKLDDRLILPFTLVQRMLDSTISDLYFCR